MRSRLDLGNRQVVVVELVPSGLACCAPDSLQFIGDCVFSRDAVAVRSIPIGAGHPLALIAGPCVIESEAHVRMMARELRAVAAAEGVPYLFKASYDKANRMSLSSYRGPGLKAGLAILAGVKREFDLPILVELLVVRRDAGVEDRIELVAIGASEV